MAGVSITITVPQLPTPTVDEDGISAWITARLSDGRNTFIDATTPTGGAYHRSQAGQFPVGQTGQLAASVPEPEVAGREGRIYSDAPYAPYLARKARLMLSDALAQALQDRPRPEVLARAVRFKAS